MHSTVVRIQNSFGFFTTVAFFTALSAAVSVLFIPQTPSAKLEPVLRNLQVVKGRPNYYSPKREEYAHIKFDLDADFTSLFNWNTKQIFVWITATYPVAGKLYEAPFSQAVIWDTIIKSQSQLQPFNPLTYLKKQPLKSRKSKSQKGIRKEEPRLDTGIIRLKNSKPKYQITDISGIISERQNVTLEIGWNVQPWVGALLWTMEDGQVLWKWKGVQGGMSKSFDMPALKGKSASSETVIGSGGTPQAATASPVV
ncbi:uncharacterized protein KY384_005274 [Bacidia gigantensis]|uniref:uncharacterized protein n=1 Tax=Bacidia gigantensis TaxID=2732470 RepID=UPI001D041693|nr:uncharacterized protein KY384_005274 [Bacidia gigantensis]KAG8529793.1 hypothetical protein KY384_005274 [Bacidia gigantensis]